MGMRRPSPDDTALAGALAARGVRAELAAWDDPSVPWARYDLTVVRSTWNYHHHRDRFLRWAGRVARHSDLWNPLPTLRWNTDKRYLSELEDRGVPTVPTLFFPPSSAPDLRRIFREHRWRQLVAKPTVSANAWRTVLVNRANVGAQQRRVATFSRSGGLMVQPYQSSVETVGERSLVFLDGRFSHAVRREAVLLGRRPTMTPGTVRATAEQVKVAGRALACCPTSTLYARVDLIQGPDRAWRVGEVEVTEPFLFLTSRPGASELLAEAIERRLARRGRSHT